MMEEQSDTINKSTDTTTSTSIQPKNVSARLWEKFKTLEKRTNEVTQKSTDKRIRQLQKQVMDTVKQEFTSAEDKAILEKCDLKLVQQEETSKIKIKRKSADYKSQTGAATSNHGAIDDLKGFLNINEHLQLRDNSRPPPPTALENHINDAIKSGDIQTAESLSDHLATRELGEKIVSAIDAKKFMEEKKVEEASAKAKRKRKLNWGFEPKHRWETKGNM
uniref:Protein FAM204A n=1 Tax=Arion vulgaris TaxID=1028688 RepID=A0A0B7ARG9_9EUPU